MGESYKDEFESSPRNPFWGRLIIALHVGGAALFVAGLIYLSQMEKDYPFYEPGKPVPTEIGQQPTPDASLVEQ